MSKLRPVPHSLLYENPTSRVRILSGFYSPSSLPVAIKEQSFTTFEEANILLREALALSTLQHPCIIKLLDCYLETDSEGVAVITIVTELMQGDLKGEIDKRKLENRYWTEGELWEIMKKLISALSFAQGKGIAHRDLKPQNIFTSGDIYKIGDFGSTALNFNSQEHQSRSSMCGSPFYLSPELKFAYLSLLRNSGRSLHYDPIKSDVYSLGVVLLEIAALDAPLGLAEVEQLQGNTERLVREIRYEFMKPWIAAMLERDPADRPSFQDLEKHVERAEWELTTRAAQLSIPIPASPISEDIPPASTSPVAPGECAVCSQPILAELAFFVPRYLSQYSNIAGSFCSTRCLEQATGAWPKRLCPHCYFEISLFSPSEAQELPCGHYYHITCFGRVILEKRMQSEREKLVCPVCVPRRTSVLEALPAEAVRQASQSILQLFRQ